MPTACNIEGNTVWLQAVRMGNAFAFHYSLDGEHFYMTRYFHLPVGDTVRSDWRRNLRRAKAAYGFLKPHH